MLKRILLVSIVFCLVISTFGFTEKTLPKAAASTGFAHPGLLMLIAT